MKWSIFITLCIFIWQWKVQPNWVDAVALTAFVSWPILAFGIGVKTLKDVLSVLRK